MRFDINSRLNDVLTLQCVFRRTRIIILITFSFVEFRERFTSPLLNNVNRVVEIVHVWPRAAIATYHVDLIQIVTKNLRFYFWLLEASSWLTTVEKLFAVGQLWGFYNGWSIKDERVGPRLLLILLIIFNCHDGWLDNRLWPSRRVEGIPIVEIIENFFFWNAWLNARLAWQLLYCYGGLWTNW